MNKLFTIINSKILIELIKLTEQKLVLISPGITNEVAIAIAQQINEKKINSVEIILDSNPEAIRFGYGQIEAIKTLEKFNVKIRVQKGIRIGIIITDDVSLMFTPTPLNLEEELNNDSTPNAIYLGKKQVEDILDSILPDRSEKTKMGKSEIGEEEIKKEEIKAIEKDLTERPPIKPDLARRMLVVSSKFQFVDIQFGGARLKNHSFSLNGKDLGIKNNALANRITARYKLFDEKQLLSIEKKFDLEEKLKKIKKHFLLSVPGYGTILYFTKRKEFEKSLLEFQKLIDKQKNEVEDQLRKTLEVSRDKVIPWMKQNLKRLGKSELEEILYPMSINDLDNFVYNYVADKFPTAKSMLENISFSLKITNVSDQLINDEKFKSKIGKVLKLNFEEIVKVESAVGAEQQEELFN